MSSNFIFGKSNRFAVRSAVPNGGQRGCRGMKNMAVNGIRKEYTEVLENRKCESVIERNRMLACKKWRKRP